MAVTPFVALIPALVALGAAPDATAEPAPAFSFGYNGGYTLTARTDATSYQLKVGGQLQTRLGGRVTDIGDDTLAFSVARARIILGGHVLTTDLTWKLSLEIGGGFAYLRDYYVDYAFTPGLHLRAGQWRRPISRQHMTSSTRLALIDRGITDGAFRAGRDIGLALHNGYERSPGLEWAFGVFNGTGDRPRLSGVVEVDPATGEGRIVSGRLSNIPDRFEPALVLRVGYNSAGMAGEGYNESDRKPKRGARFAVAASGLVDVGFDDTPAEAVVSIDAIVKVSGFTASAAAYARLALDEATAGEALGFHAQASYALTAWLEATARYAVVAPDADDADARDEIAVGLTTWALSDHLKWQVDAASLGVGDRRDWRVQTQLQLTM